MNTLSRQAPEFLETNVIHVDGLPQGTLLGEFEILGLLGVGGFGMVYGAYDHSLHRTVAIKEYMPAALASRVLGTALSVRSSVDQSTYFAGLTSFVAEARLLAQFDHPSLVKVYRFWEANNTAYMAMPLYLGMTLKQARGQMPSPPPEAWLRKVLWSLLGALKLLHDNNLLHRDVSPDNIFLQNTGPPVLLDLGSARRAVLDANKKHTAVLKVNYAPIEQYADAADLIQGPWTDLYALAAVVHGCLCNEPPLPATFRVLVDRMPPIARVAATVQEHFGQSYSADFVAAIGHALAIQPGDRPQSINVFAQEMRLGPPGDMMRFDWRAELGRVLKDEPTADAAPSAPTVAATDLELTVAQPGAVGTNAPASVGARKRFGVMVLGVALLATGWLAWNARTGSGEPDVTAKPSLARPTASPRAATPASAASAADSSRAGPVALCADRSFLTRPMCIHRACQKPQFAPLAVCVEDRRRSARQRERVDP
ncbi:serine/threonine protein kinase [Rhodoferax sp.]|uniref:serine/threonine protein kinase n=1 Tax=Rhodoferax sp. TaxID=50421 RepID=UPI0027567F4D|nr:serine/threonine-protein kinase [Rhodoferax sp.]